MIYLVNAHPLKSIHFDSLKYFFTKSNFQLISCWLNYEGSYVLFSKSLSLLNRVFGSVNQVLGVVCTILTSIKYIFEFLFQQSLKCPWLYVYRTWIIQNRILKVSSGFRTCQSLINLISGVILAWTFQNLQSGEKVPVSNLFGSNPIFLSCLWSSSIVSLSWTDFILSLIRSSLKLMANFLSSFLDWVT